MKILSFKPNHDGTRAYINNGRLEYSIESEKDSRSRYSPLSIEDIFDSLIHIPETPDVIALGGWWSNYSEESTARASKSAPYLGASSSVVRAVETSIMGNKVKMFSSSHERSHIFCSYAMSPFRQGEPVYALVWEGVLGKFYEVTPDLDIIELGSALSYIGTKYEFPYFLASADKIDPGQTFFAGKVMALCAFGEANSKDDPEIAQLVAEIMDTVTEENALDKDRFRESDFYCGGVDNQRFMNLVSVLSDTLFARFLETAQNLCTKNLPLIIGGGCGLNCEWNTKWKESGLFSDVFVPPCTNDTGSAIGTAAEAQFYYTGNAKIEWDVYSGPEFITDTDVFPGYKEQEFDVETIAKVLFEGGILALAQGRAEIGPRALGNRSLIASPFSEETRDRLNEIKQREWYRPVAPVCLEEDCGEHFSDGAKSPYMLYFSKVVTPSLKAITHVDKSARVQTVNSTQNPTLHSILKAFKKASTVGVLCNTSLNFLGVGFINRATDLVSYATSRNLEGFIINDRLFLKE